MQAIEMLNPRTTQLITETYASQLPVEHFLIFGVIAIAVVALYCDVFRRL